MTNHELEHAAYGPPPTSPTEALAHTLTVFAGQPDDAVAIRATSNLYGPGVVTGLTFGDLRNLLKRLEDAESKLFSVEVLAKEHCYDDPIFNWNLRAALGMED